jgi:CRISPR system Cascade subunit CasD
MTATLLLRLSGPMQSWGTQSRFTDRDTGREPSKSGVIGLLCAALGRPRTAALDDLVALTMGVRVDREGIPKVDYQTAGGTHRRGDRYGVAKASGAAPDTVESTRHYLADADFLVGLESDDIALLQRLNTALAAPVWPLYLGRKGYVPSLSVRLPDEEPYGPGVRAVALVQALREYPWPGPRQDGEREPVPARLRLVLEAAPEEADVVRCDVPISFSQRQFRTRYVKNDSVSRPGRPT